MRAGTLIGTRADRGLGPDPRHYRLTLFQVEALAEYEAATLAGQDTPSLAELGRRFGRSRQVVFHRVQGLVRKGWLVLPPDGRHRYVLSEAAIRHLHSYEPEITAWIPRRPRHA